MQTYGGLACNKPGLNKEHHVQAYGGNWPPPLLPGEILSTTNDYAPVKIDLDPSATEGIRHTSRINVGKVYSVNHNLRFCPVGHVKEEDFSRLLVLIAWATNPLA
jgi:hypothetical protein